MRPIPSLQILRWIEDFKGKGGRQEMGLAGGGIQEMGLAGEGRQEVGLEGKVDRTRFCGIFARNMPKNMSTTN